MGDSEDVHAPSKKRAAGRELTKDNAGLDDEEDSSEQETGTFKRASEEVLATRKIVKVRKSHTSSTPSPNPFSGIRFVPPPEPAATSVATSATPSESNSISAGITAESPDSGEKTVSKDERKDAGGSDKNEDDNNKQSDIKTNEAVAESGKSTSEDVNNLENKIDQLSSEAAADKESPQDKTQNVADEATKEKTEDIKPGEGIKLEGEDKKDNDETENKDEKDNKKTENGDEKDDISENVNSGAEGASLSSFQQLSSSQNAFTGLAGTGFSSSTFSFGTLQKDGSAAGTGSLSLFGQKSDQPSFGFGLSTNGNSSLFNTSTTSVVSKKEGSGFPSMQEVAVETGEENERVIFSADSALFEFLDGKWKERGKGELKVNVSTTGEERARLLMRARGNYRLILNASLYPDMKLTNMDKKGITFACVNSIGEGKDGLATFALKFKDASFVEDFRATVMAHKGKVATATTFKTPENSPKASEG